MPHSGQFPAVPLPRDNRSNDLHSCQAGDIRDDVMQLQIHLGHGFLHVLDVRSGIFDQHVTVSQIAAQRDKVTNRPK